MGEARRREVIGASNTHDGLEWRRLELVSRAHARLPDKVTCAWGQPAPLRATIGLQKAYRRKIEQEKRDLEAGARDVV